MMLPLMLDIESTPIAIVGNGFAAVMRLKLVDQSDAGRVTVFADQPSVELRQAARHRLVERMPEDQDFRHTPYKIVYIGDMDEKSAESLAHLARQFGALVNVHDIKALCDFHVPARLVRGDLQVTVSTNGRAAGLSRILRDYLAQKVFGPDWAARVTSLGSARDRWREDGASFDDLVRRTETFVADRGWLADRAARKSLGREG